MIDLSTSIFELPAIHTDGDYTFFSSVQGKEGSYGAGKSES
jgi:hypothetical protein